MPYVLRDNVSYCVVDGRCYFIDLTTNRYFALSLDLSRSLSQLHEGRSEIGPIASGLAELVLECSAGTGHRLAPFSSRAPGELGRDGAERAKPLDVVKAIFLYLTSAKRDSGLTLTGLASKLDTARKPTTHETRDRQGQLASIAMSIAAAKSLLGDHDLCLRWSYVTSRLLLKAGHPARIVFGVSAQPFSAHCWVESDDLLVADTLERISVYTPLLAL